MRIAKTIGLPIALLGSLATACTDFGDQTELATVRFTNSTDEVAVVDLIGDAEGLETALQNGGDAWHPIAPGETGSPMNWATSQQMDLSVRPLCQSGSSWYVLALGPTAREGQALTLDDVTVVEILEHPCWDDQHATYTIEQN